MSTLAISVHSLRQNSYAYSQAPLICMGWKLKSAETATPASLHLSLKEFLCGG